MTPADAIAELVRIAGEGIFAETWTQPREDDPQWHHSFRDWQAIAAARLAVAAILAHPQEVITALGGEAVPPKYPRGEWLYRFPSTKGQASE